MGCVGSGGAHTLAVSSYSHETHSRHPSTPELTKRAVFGETCANDLFVVLNLQVLILQHVRARCDAAEAESQVRSPVPPEPDVPAP